MVKTKVKSDDRTITVRVPISIRKRGGRKLVLAPDGTPGGGHLFYQRADSALVKAIARAFRWRDMLENGVYATIKEIAAAEAINESYVARILRLTLLAPSIVESVVDGRQPPQITLPALLRRFPALWQVQRSTFQHVDAQCSLAARYGKD
jgi:hypothetical protein